MTTSITLDEMREIAAVCTLCDLHKGRNKAVFDKGNPESKLMICGMVPAYDENREGFPFVGSAGKLLDKILAKAALSPQDVYVTNLVKCFLAPGKPLMPIWISSCLPYIIGQISIIRPSIILCLGLDAAKSLLNLPDDVKMKNIRGRVSNYSDTIEVIPTYHPSFLLRSGGEKSDYFGRVVEDFDLALYALTQKEGI